MIEHIPVRLFADDEVIVNTRFAPTPDSFLHIGHVWMALLNHGVAHETGGCFWLRLDDLYHPKSEMAAISDSIIEDMEWVGVPPDRIVRQSEWQELFETESRRGGIIEQLDFPTTVLFDNIGRHHVRHETCLSSVLRGVICDHEMNIKQVIRGEEMIHEQSAYVDFCSRLGFDVPRFAYLSRVEVDGIVVAGSRGMWPVRRLREQGVQPEEIIIALRRACLYDPDRNIVPSNIVAYRPQLDVSQWR